MIQPITEPDLDEGRRRPLPDLARRPALDQPGDHRVLECGHVAEQVVELEDESHVLATITGQPRFASAPEVLAREEDPPCGRMVEPSEQVQQRRFPDAGGADQRDELARAHRDASAPEHAHNF